MEDEEHLKYWLIKVTINLCNNYNNSFWNKRTSEIEETLCVFDEEETFKM